jgi:hypothetical protein
MMDCNALRGLRKDCLLAEFSRLVDQDRQNTATLVACIAEIDRRKLYLEHACSSMFAFCTRRFGMSEAIAHKRIRGGRAASRFPCILDMLARGEIHLTGVHQLASHLTEDNHQVVLERAKHKSMREIEKLIAEIAPMPDAPSRIRALPIKKVSMPLPSGEASSPEAGPEAVLQASAAPSVEPKPRPVPLSPRRYKLQVTIGQETRDKLDELQALLSHQIPDGDPAEILDRALDALLAETKKKKAALTDKPRQSSKRKQNQRRGIPAHVRREVFERDEGRCVFVDARGCRCGSRWQVEFHHRVPYARGGTHGSDNIELRCRAHNQYEAELDYGVGFMETRRRRSAKSARTRTTPS